MTKKRVLAPIASPENKKRKRWTQLSLDVGQRDISAKKCVGCGMVFAPGVDSAAHMRFHKSAIRGPRLTKAALRELSPVGRHNDASIFVISKQSSKSAIRAANAVAAYSTIKLGVEKTSKKSELYDRARAVLAVRGNDVVAYCFVERIAMARIVQVRRDARVVVDDNMPSVMTPFCGVRLLWVSDKCRRKGFATAVVDAARAHLAYGHVYPRKHVAFTSPTADGSRFALRYAPQKLSTSVELSCVPSISIFGREDGDRDRVMAAHVVSDEMSKGDSSVKETLGHVLVYEVQKELSLSTSELVRSAHADESEQG